MGVPGAWPSPAAFLTVKFLKKLKADAQYFGIWLKTAERINSLTGTQAVECPQASSQIASCSASIQRCFFVVVLVGWLVLKYS